MSVTGLEISCRHRLDAPETAGCADKATLLEKAALYPHLRPCTLHRLGEGWNWIYRTACGACPLAVRVKSPSPAEAGEGREGAL